MAEAISATMGTPDFVPARVRLLADPKWDMLAFPGASFAARAIAARRLAPQPNVDKMNAKLESNLNPAE